MCVGAGTDVIRQGTGGLLAMSDCPTDLAGFNTAARGRAGLPEFRSVFLSRPDDWHRPTVVNPKLAPHIAAAAAIPGEYNAQGIAQRAAADWKSLVSGSGTSERLKAIRQLAGYTGTGEQRYNLDMIVLDQQLRPGERPVENGLSHVFQEVLAPDVFDVEQYKAAEDRLMHGRGVEDGEEYDGRLGSELEKALFPRLAVEEGGRKDSIPISFKYPSGIKNQIVRVFAFIIHVVVECVRFLLNCGLYPLALPFTRKFGVLPDPDLYGRFKFKLMMADSESKTSATGLRVPILSAANHKSLHHMYGHEATSPVSNGLRLFLLNIYHFARMRAAVELSHEYDHRQIGLIAALATTDRKIFIEALYNNIRGVQADTHGGFVSVHRGVFEENDYVQHRVAESIYNALVAGVAEMAEVRQQAVSAHYARSFVSYVRLHAEAMCTDTALASDTIRKVTVGEGSERRRVDYFDYLRDFVAQHPMFNEKTRGVVLDAIAAAKEAADAAKRSFDKRVGLKSELSRIANQLAANPRAQVGQALQAVAEQVQSGLTQQDQTKVETLLAGVRSAADKCGVIVHNADQLRSRIAAADTVGAAEALQLEAGSFYETNLRQLAGGGFGISDELHAAEAAVGCNYAMAQSVQTSIADPLVAAAKKQVESLQGRDVHAGAIAGLRVQSVEPGKNLQADISSVIQLVDALRQVISRDPVLLPAHRDALLARLNAKQGELMAAVTNRYLDGIGDISLFYQLPNVREQVAQLDRQYPGLNLMAIVDAREKAGGLVVAMLAGKRGMQLQGESLGALRESWPVLLASTSYQPLRQDWLNLAIDRALLLDVDHRSTDEAIAGRIIADFSGLKGLPSHGNLTRLVQARMQSGASVAGIVENVNRLAGAIVYQEAMRQVVEKQAALVDITQLEQAFFSTPESPVAKQQIMDLVAKHCQDLPVDMGRAFSEKFLMMMRGVGSVTDLNVRVMTHLADRPSLLAASADLLARFAAKLDEEIAKRVSTPPAGKGQGKG